jgi:hypothetical protein
LSNNFKDKTTKAKITCIQRFVKWVGLSNRVSTHVAQKNHRETEEESSHFLVLMRQKVSAMNPDDVLNMDQTPIPFTFHRTLEKKGTRWFMPICLPLIQSVQHSQPLWQEVVSC